MADAVELVENFTQADASFRGVDGWAWTSSVACSSWLKVEVVDFDLTREEFGCLHGVCRKQSINALAGPALDQRGITCHLADRPE